MTSLVEQMASHFGKELTLLYINKYPSILELDFSTLLQRVKAFRELCGVLDSDVPMMLRKNPGLVMLEPHEMRTRYDNLRELTRFNNQEVRDMHVQAADGRWWWWGGRQSSSHRFGFNSEGFGILWSAQWHFFSTFMQQVPS